MCHPAVVLTTTQSTHWLKATESPLLVTDSHYAKDVESPKVTIYGPINKKQTPGIISLSGAESVSEPGRLLCLFYVAISGLSTGIFSGYSNARLPPLSVGAAAMCFTLPPL